MQIVKTCLNEHKRLSAAYQKYLAKTFDTLIKTIYMLLYTTEHPHPTFLTIYFRN